MFSCGRFELCLVVHDHKKFTMATYEYPAPHFPAPFCRTPAEDLMDLVGEILAKEPLVSSLVAAQALDVLEVEGGGLVFERLVSLCGGSK